MDSVEGGDLLAGRCAPVHELPLLGGGGRARVLSSMVARTGGPRKMSLISALDILMKSCRF